MTALVSRFLWRGRFIGLVLGVLALGGCLRFGSTGENLTPAKGPNGVQVVVQTAESIAGELLATRDEGLVLLSRGHVVLVPYTAIRLSTVVEEVVRLRPFTTPPMRDRERLRLLSRFPDGVPDGYLAQLLANANQDAITVAE